MNFFRSLLSEEPDSPNEEDPLQAHHAEPDKDQDRDENDVISEPDHENAESSGGGSMWVGFGGLIQTLTTRSESVLETYRRDLQEFGSGLRKETELFREVASRAVKELPASIEVAHGALDGVIKSTAEIISNSKEALPAQSPSEDARPDTPERSISSGRYSWFDSQLAAIQNDVNTFCEDPEDLEEYNKWKSLFVSTEKSEEIENLIGENGALEDMYKRMVVSNEVDQETFWCRYFYRVDKLKQQESVRANLVKRAITIDDDEEELSWDLDDDEENDNGVDSSDSKRKGGESVQKEQGDEKTNNNVVEESVQNRSVAGESLDVKQKVDESESVKNGLGDHNSNKNVEKESTPNVNVAEESGENESNMENDDKGGGVVSIGQDVWVSSVEKSEGGSEVKSKGEIVVSKENAAVSNAETEAKPEGKSDQGGVGKDSDVSVASTQQYVPEEEDMGWDEIEDIDSSDEKKFSASSGSANRADVRKRLNATEEDEDLSWDIEDDD